MANSKHTLQTPGPEEGKRGESMLENTVYGVNMNFLWCKYPILNCHGSFSGVLPGGMASWRSITNRVRLPPGHSIDVSEEHKVGHAKKAPLRGEARRIGYLLYIAWKVGDTIGP